MSKFIETFEKSPVLLPVIHVENEAQALKNAEIALREGCDGAFLISMRGMKHDGLLKIHNIVKREFPSFWLGVNFLDLDALEVFDKLNEEVGGVWVDDAKIIEHLPLQVEANSIKQKQLKSGWNGLYFGGVAFKYQGHVDNPDIVAKIAADYMDVVTTSGSATGSPPDIHKITSMKKAIGNTPLSIASGITPENVSNYVNIADCFLTATSLLIPGTENFSSDRVRSLVDNIRK